jgi:hypothetical protein
MNKVGVHVSHAEYTLSVGFPKSKRKRTLQTEVLSISSSSQSLGIPQNMGWEKGVEG